MLQIKTLNNNLDRSKYIRSKELFFQKDITYWVKKFDSSLPYSNYRHPIFIIAPPRSGSTFLFNCLSEFDGVYHLIREADYIWWLLFPYERMENPSDYIGQKQITPQALRDLRRLIYKGAITNYTKRLGNSSKFSYHFGFRPIRYLDKTIANCFHLNFLKYAFPKARYVFLVRDPRSNISSMMEGWRNISQFGKPQLTDLFPTSKNLSVSHWTYPAPPGWQEILTEPLPKICAWSWKQHVQHALHFFRQNRINVIEVRYEELVRDTVAVVSAIADNLALKMSKKTEAYLKNAPLSWTTETKPYEDKWKDKNFDAILSILPDIKNTALQIGYEVSFQ